LRKKSDRFIAILAVLGPTTEILPTVDISTQGNSGRIERIVDRGIPTPCFVRLESAETTETTAGTELRMSKVENHEPRWNNFPRYIKPLRTNQ
jgi:hypothetical protein